MMGCWLKSSLDFVTKSFRDRTLCWEEQQSLRVLMCECCFNAVGFCCSCLYGTGRSIPLISIFSFILFLIGYSLALSGRTATSKPLETMGVTTLTGFMQDLEVAFFFAFVPWLQSSTGLLIQTCSGQFVNKICVLQSFWEEQAVSSVKVFNGLGLIASFLASGKTREFLFQRTDYCCTSCFQFLLGRCTLGIIVSFCLLILLVAPWTKIWLPNHSEVFNVYNHMHSEAVSAFSNDMDPVGLAATSMDSSASFQDKDIVLLSLVASASSLVLEVTGACAVADSLRSPVSATLEIVTGVKLPLEAFDAICKPLTLMVPVAKSLNRLWLDILDMHLDDFCSVVGEMA